MGSGSWQGKHAEVMAVRESGERLGLSSIDKRP
jgi:hypothetical protein